MEQPTLPPIRMTATISPYATVFSRSFAFIIDLAVISSLQVILLNMVPWSFFVQWLVGLFVYVSYFFLMTWLNHGQTLGKMITNIQVVNYQLDTLNWQEAFFREVIGRVIQKVMYILYLVFLVTPRKRSVADFIAQTVVVNRDVVINE